jgi:UPF0176 protein
MVTSTPQAPFTVAALYRFARLADPAGLRAPLSELCRSEGIRGTLIIAPEGVNGTVAGSRGAIDRLIEHLARVPGLAGIEPRLSTASLQPFRRMKVRVKREIVTLGVDGIDAAGGAGSYVAPGDWNAMIADPGTVVIDARNDYEIAIGSFEGAVDPGTGSFRAFPAWVEENRERLAGRRIAMFCTGGIRCEKATAYVKSIGFDDVHHLKGGILAYLEAVPASESLWRGECFVFDERVALGHGLVEGEAELCHACGHPLTSADRDHAAYRPGVACPHCEGRYDENDRARFAERQRQIDLATVRAKPAFSGAALQSGVGPPTSARDPASAHPAPQAKAMRRP